MDLNKLPKFDKSQRSTFKYWWAHYRAFNIVAYRCHAWKFKYLFHDIEKPFLMILWNNDYSRVQNWHRIHNKHHIQYKNPNKIDWEAMAIDWECSQYTKKSCPRNAFQQYLLELGIDYNFKLNFALRTNMQKALKKLNLWNNSYV